MTQQSQDSRFVRAVDAVSDGGMQIISLAQRIRWIAIGLVCSLFTLLWGYAAIASLLIGFQPVMFLGVGLMTLAVGWTAKKSFQKAFGERATL